MMVLPVIKSRCGRMGYNKVNACEYQFNHHSTMV